MNAQLLDKTVKDSGLKWNYIAGRLGITTQAVRNKRKGITDFTKSEQEVLASILNMTDEQRLFIFDS